MAKKSHGGLKHLTITDMKADDLRDTNAQKKFRDKSQSKNKRYEHVSHRFPLKIAAYLNNKRFIDPPRRRAELKPICNDERNLEMVPIAENMVDHRDTDNMLVKEFETKISTEFDKNAQYKDLLKINPSQLEFEMRTNEMSCIILSEYVFQRAKEQTAIVQKLNFHIKYVEVARLFYRCFQDPKGRKVWDDNQNSSEFKKYLQLRLNKNDDDEKHAVTSSVPTKKEKKSKVKKEDENSSKFKKRSKYNSNDDEKGEDVCIGIDDKGRKWYEGPNGAKYYKPDTDNNKKKVYMSSLGHKPIIHELKYKKDGEIDKRCKAYKLMTTKGNTTNESSQSNKRNKMHEKKKGKNKDICVRIDDKGREVYKSARGKLYYFTKSGNRVYINRKK